jgi:steroid 5-alpha reductase family enzyme
VRLTHNFLRGWRGLAHEDWRYVDVRNKTGRF